MTETTPREILRKAAELLAERGWCQGTLTDNEGHLCAIGAIRTAALGSAWLLPFGPDDVGVEASLMLSAHVSTDGTYGLVSLWNDLPTTTAEDVILAMKRAAEDVRP